MLSAVHCEYAGNKAQSEQAVVGLNEISTWEIVDAELVEINFRVEHR